MRYLVGMLALAVVWALTAVPVSAVTIFMDDFNRANNSTVGNGWLETENNAGDVAIRNGRLRLRDILPGPGIDAAASQLGGLEATGLSDIALMYDWSATSNTESSDDLFVQWKLTSQAMWTTLVTHTLGGSGFVSNTVQLGAGADGQSDIQIRFFTDVSTETEAAFIDNVKLTGEVGTSPVPEPATFALFGLGLIGLGWVQYRRVKMT